MPNANETTESNYPSSQAANENEHISLKRTLRFVRKTDDLGTAIYCALESILEKLLTKDENVLTIEEAEDIIQSLPSMELIKVPGFFNRIPFPFCILRCIMAIYDVDHVPTDFLDRLRLSEDKKSNSRQHELLWFLMFIGSDVNEVSGFLEHHKVQLAEMKSTSESNSFQEQSNTTVSIQTLPPPGTSSQRNQQQCTRVPELSMTRALKRSSTIKMYELETIHRDILQLKFSRIRTP